MTFEILYKEYSDYCIYPINKTTYLKIFKGYSDYLEYYFSCGTVKFYATNNKLFPLDIFDNKMSENYIASVSFGEDWTKDKVIYNKFSNEKLNIQITEYNGFFSKEVICKKNDSKVFEMYEKSITFSKPRIILKGEIEGNELELFITFLSFFIQYSNVTGNA